MRENVVQWLDRRAKQCAERAANSTDHGEEWEASALRYEEYRDEVMKIVAAVRAVVPTDNGYDTSKIGALRNAIKPYI